MDQDYRIYRIMHVYGKLVSCDANNPQVADKMFLEDLKKEFKNGKV